LVKEFFVVRYHYHVNRFYYLLTILDSTMDKTVAVLFTHRREGIESTLKINDDYVKVEKKAKFLGLVFDSKLTWKEHVDYVVDKCKKTFKFYEGDCRK